MSIEKYSLFVQSVYRAEYDKAEELKKQIIPLFKDFEKNNPLEDGTNYPPGSYTSFYNASDIFSIYNNELEDLKQWINSKVLEVSNANGINLPMCFITSWFSINRKYSYHSRHNHTPHVWSGVYYVQSDFDEDAMITFAGPNNESRWPYANLESFNEETKMETTMKSNTGSLWIFPSYMNHEVTQQLSDNERISIAFNFDYIGR